MFPCSALKKYLYVFGSCFSLKPRDQRFAEALISKGKYWVGLSRRLTQSLNGPYSVVSLPKSTCSELPWGIQIFWRFNFRISRDLENFPIFFTKGKVNVMHCCYVPLYFPLCLYLKPKTRPTVYETWICAEFYRDRRYLAGLDLLKWRKTKTVHRDKGS